MVYWALYMVSFITIIVAIAEEGARAKYPFVFLMAVYGVLEVWGMLHNHWGRAEDNQPRV